MATKQASAARRQMIHGCARACMSSCWARMQAGKERRQLPCCRGARRAWRGEALPNNALCAMDTYKTTAVAGGCALVESSSRAGAAFPALVRLLPSSLPGGHGRRTPESGHQGGTVFHLPSTPWVPEIRPINISRSKMKQGLTWYRLQRLRTALSRHGCAPLASPPPRIELCALELICRDHARDAGTLRH